MGAGGIGALAPGQTVSISRTVTEADVTLFAGLSGDLNPFHVDEQFAAGTRFGRRIAHGALLVAYSSAAFTRYCQQWLEPGTAARAISYGYDRIRFVAPTYLGDTITTEYRIDSVDAASDKAFAAVTCTNQRGETVAVAAHVIKLI
jgi:3-hydroxybutyryl-CoA dehydratase